MAQQLREKKFERTSQEQLRFYIAYAKMHPELLPGKNTPVEIRQKMWEELAKNLNCLKGPTRSAVKWKISLANCKKQWRSRARKLKAAEMRTCGGPKPADSADVKCQAFGSLGTIEVDGIPEEEMGCEWDSVSSTDYEDLEFRVAQLCSPTLSSSPQCSSSSNAGSASNSRIDAKPPSKANKKGEASQSLVNVLLKYLRKRDEHDKRVLEQQTRTNDALFKLGEGLLAVAEAIKRQ